MKEYTITEIARELKAPESTVRGWRNRFIEFIPYHGQGRKRRYPEQALPVFRLIAELFAEGMTADTVAERLSAATPRYIDNRDNNSGDTATPQPDLPMLRVANALEMIIKQQQDNQSLQQQIDELKDRVKKLEDKRPFWKRK